MKKYPRFERLRRWTHESYISQKLTSPPMYQAVCLCGWATTWPGERSHASVSEALRQHEMIARGSSEP